MKKVKYHRAAQKVFHDWCEENGCAVDIMLAADLVDRIAKAIEDTIHRHAVERGVKGGKVRNAVLSPERRSEIARIAGKARAAALTPSRRSEIARIGGSTLGARRQLSLE